MFDKKKYDEYLEEHIGNVKKAYDLLVYSGVFDYSRATKDAIDEHDASKYDEEEYDAYGEYFYGDKKDVEHKDDEDFQRAWLHHQHHNPHHWQYWLLREDDGGKPIALEMPLEYVQEMICDWLAFSIKNNNLKEIQKWYDENNKNQILHKKTKKLVEKYLEDIRKLSDEKTIDEIFNIK